MTYLESRSEDHLESVIAENTGLLDEIDATVTMMQEKSERNALIIRWSLLATAVLALAGMLTALIRKIEEIARIRRQLEKLEELLPICSGCKRIRLEDGDPQDPAAWVQVESYMSREADKRFTHSICPDCDERLYSDYR